MHLTKQAALWDKFLEENPQIEFVWVQYHSFRATFLVQVLPVAGFTKLVYEDQPVALTRTALFLLPFAHRPAGSKPGGVCYLRPDVSTAYCHVAPNAHRAVINASSFDENGRPMEECPRSHLGILSDLVKEETSFYPLVGFEVEVMYMRRIRQNGKLVNYEIMDEPHSLYSMTNDDWNQLPMIEATARAMLKAGIAIDKFHSEHAPGQWEFVLPPGAPVDAVDMLLKARSIIYEVAEQYDLKATMCPRPSCQHPGNGMHVHLSMNAVFGRDVKDSEAFFAGILEHLPAVMAFSFSQEASYSRVASGVMSGGEYVCWGWENKDAPLRRVAINRFEIKSLDALANPYLALCGILAAGIDGMRKNLHLTAKSSFSAAKLSHSEREELGIKVMLPKSLSESLGALEADRTLCDLVGDAIVNFYVPFKRGELEMFQKMTDEEKHKYLIGTY
jgi:glutamine synthetase